jgi:hypothetical protein
MVNRIFCAWLRPALAVFGFAGVMVLAACGGGSGAPNNPYAPIPSTPAPLQILPNGITIYPGTPATLTISGGVPPYRAFSANATILPVTTNISGDTLVLAANNVTTNTGVILTIQDSAGSTLNTTATVAAAPLLSTLITVTGNLTQGCVDGSNTVCSGVTGTARVKVTGNGGVGIKGRSVKFDVVQGNFQIVSTNPAQPLVQTLTVVSDGNGDAVVVLSVPADTPTQTGIIRATEITSGQSITGTFLIQQLTVGGATLSVLPQGTTTINGPDNTRCSSGVSVTHYIFGGTPPYNVAINFPGAATVTGVPVTKSGGGFVTTTNGTCFINLTYVITDANGITIPGGSYPTVTNQLGTNAPIPPVTTLVVTPGAISKVNCTPTNTFQFIGTGGVAPYSAVVTSTTSPTSPTLTPQTGLASGQAVTVSGLSSPSTTVITLLDNSTPRQSGSVTIDCTGTVPPPTPPALTVTPAQAGSATTSCPAQTFTFVVTGGTPPYNVFFQVPKVGAVINPTTVPTAGGTFQVTNLPNGAPTANPITIVDSSVPQNLVVATITCQP